METIRIVVYKHWLGGGKSMQFWSDWYQHWYHVTWLVRDVKPGDNVYVAHDRPEHERVLFQPDVDVTPA